MIPLLIDLTQEDKAAKGLRRAEAVKPRPVQVTALEAVADTPWLLLTAPRGGGRTAFAQLLARHLPHDPALLAAMVPRNEEGDVLPQSWPGPALPVLLSDGAILGLPDDDSPLLLVVDAAERVGPAILERAAALGAARPSLRMLLLGEAPECDGWPLPAGFKRHRILPLTAAARRAFRAAHDLPAREEAGWLGHPGLFALSLEAQGDSAPALVDAWLAAHPRHELRKARFVQDHLAALAMIDLPEQEIAARFAEDAEGLDPVLRILAARAPARIPALAQALLATPRGAVMAAGIAPDAPGLVPALLRVVTEGLLAIPLRVAAGRHLARLGDPRDLEALVAVPGGAVAMGSALHPNSAPPHQVTVAPFRIGRFPVTNRLYRRFVEATGRAWRSTDGLRPERANAPAVDVTWHDARACCDWLTATWRAEGRIGADETVRLPTEAEWECAARGAQPDAATTLYPWAGPWQPDRANSEEAGLNDTCAVGLFPRGRAGCGAEDMTGNIWEWCSTLWGEDMATPSFRYPYADDGREAEKAAPSLRRVLRGGAFSSGREKACCTYRGSLEPAGFWRGNGFRVAVSP
jgi:iron(II)-dependent oxidoreductase